MATTDLAHHIQSIRLVDTHEHMRRENDWVENGPDILQDLFGNYVPADLVTAGASPEAMRDLMDASKDIASRFEGIREAWEATQFTGYGEAVSLIAKHIYGLDELTGDGLASADNLKTLRTPGKRYHILHDLANLDHIQTDDFSWPCTPDTSGPDFFLYDLSWATFCNGQIDPSAIHAETGVEVSNLASLKRGMEAIFAKHAGCAIAVKSQHAYNRTLNWIERSDAEASDALNTVLTQPASEINEATRLCLGDWCWARGVELTIEHNLPFKIHTGYYAGNDRMPVRRIPAGNMCALFARYLDAKFVLMHIAYPYNDELVALAKHYRNIWVDFCWAWSIDPYSSRDFLRRCIHAVPSNKLFAFGGDTGWPTSAMAYAIQARNEIRRALEAEIADGYLTEKQAMAFATRIMNRNQYACFDIDGTRANIAKAA
ncbi:amidohydrolase family protein [Candidatus Poribacteria bacterium]|nr:amidohydrolase family protein [Candidatus Poribacteria bacterium]MYK18623.1 amidohydrolase family protein [Candidatus Poribacteria bacterium]